MPVDSHAIRPGVNAHTETKARTRLEVLSHLVRVAEDRLNDGGHAQRVGELSALVAQKVGLPEAEVELIRLTAPLHDIGILGIPDSILHKPGRLSGDEYAVVKQHVDIGVGMLSHGSSELIDMARLITQTHHERFDGSGYPHGLAGNAIALPGQIVAIADFFDTLTRSRPYRKAWTVAEAIAKLRRRSGNEFNPRLVTTFLRALTAADASLRRPTTTRHGPQLKGSLDLDTLVDLLISFGHNGKSGRLLLYLGFSEALLLLNHGRVTHAEFDGLDGEAAVTALLSRATAYGEMDLLLEPIDAEALETAPVTIDISVPQLLIGASVDLDHRVGGVKLSGAA